MKNVRCALWLSVAVVVATLFSGVTRASAQDALIGKSVRIELHADLGWYGNTGIGGRVEFPVVRDGLLTHVRDELAVSLGLEGLFWYGNRYGGLGVVPVAALQWNFYLHPQWSLFAELGIAFLIGPADWNHEYYPNYIAPGVGIGVRYYFNPSVALVVRAGFPTGFSIGVQF